jgi:hypothetical protein
MVSHMQLKVESSNLHFVQAKPKAETPAEGQPSGNRAQRTRPDSEKQPPGDNRRDSQGNRVNTQRGRDGTTRQTTSPGGITFE